MYIIYLKLDTVVLIYRTIAQTEERAQEIVTSLPHGFAFINTDDLNEDLPNFYLVPLKVKGRRYSGNKRNPNQ